jgi:formylglycine-generating enzyme required for sulfatase activity
MAETSPGVTPMTEPGAAGSGDATTTSDRLAPGLLVFGRYRVERKLGEGGMGTVWLIRHVELDVPRALKLINAGMASDPQVEARFRREARLMALLSHPCAVAVHDARLGGGVAFIEMEYVEGQSLKEVLQEGVPMPLDWTARVLGQLCDVLQYTHDRGIVHRDLKPSNLMLVDGRPPGQEQLKVLDFGIAKLIDPGPESGETHAATRTGLAPFTPLYASPEQLNSEPVDARSDLYSVGVMLYEFLTGHRPFQGSWVNLSYDHCKTPPPRFAEKNPAVRIPPGIERVVLRCLAKKPEDRPQSARELAREFLTALRESAPPVAPKPPGPSPGPRPAVAPAGPDDRPRSRFRRLLGPAGLLAVAALTAGYLYPRPAPPVPKGLADVKVGSRSVAEPAEPEVFIREDGARFVRSAQGLFLPEGYEADGTGAKADWPETLRRQRDGSRYHLLRAGYYLPEGYQAAAGSGFDLRLMSSLNGVDSIPTKGENLIIVTTVRGVLYLRIFDADGRRIADTDEKQLTDKALQIARLKSLLSDLWGVPKLPQSDKDRVIRDVTSIVGHTPGSDLDRGQPPVIARRGDGRRLVWAPAGFYLPEGYEAEPSQASDPGRPPAAIVRKSDGTRFLWIAGDSFQMGALRKPTGRHWDDQDQPPHPVQVSGFYLQRTEVTNGELASYFEDRGLDPLSEGRAYVQARAELSHTKKPEEAWKHPAVGVRHRLAEQYAEWVSGRLPTEAEWEFAARSRGRKDRPFVWGDAALNAADLDQREVNIAWGGRDVPTKPVGVSPLDRTEQGVFDLAGNVREWCADVWGPYPSSTSKTLVDFCRLEPEPGHDRAYVLRGGSFETAAERAMTTHPRQLRPDEVLSDKLNLEAPHDVGLRVVIEPLRVPGSAW